MGEAIALYRSLDFKEFAPYLARRRPARCATSSRFSAADALQQRGRRALVLKG